MVTIITVQGVISRLLMESESGSVPDQSKVNSISGGTASDAKRRTLARVLVVLSCYDNLATGNKYYTLVWSLRYA